MGFTADDLVQVLTSCSGGVVDDRADAVALMREEDPALAPTLFSAWLADGSELSPALQAEVAAERARTDYYRTLDASITAKVPALTPIIGLEIADAYPAELVRHQHDLNYVAAGEADLWQATSLLMEDGWELRTATFSVVGGSIQIIVNLRRMHEDPFAIPYGVEIQTYYALGYFGARPLLTLPERCRGPAVKNILMLLYERYEQPYGSRDAIDAVVLHQALSAAELAALHDAVDDLELGVQYAELIKLVDSAELEPLPQWPRHGDAGRAGSDRAGSDRAGSDRAGSTQAAVIRAQGSLRARRLGREASFLLRPLAGTGRILQRHLLGGELTGTKAAVWAAVQRRLSVPAALTGGLMSFGLPLEGPTPQVTGTVLCRRGSLAWADTPVARFLLTLGDDVLEDDVDELTRPAGLAVETSR